MIAYLSRSVGLLAAEAELPADARILSIFVVNRRAEMPDDRRDEAFVFQVQLELESEAEFLRRPNLRGMASDDWDESVADLQYRDVGEFAVGHNVATEAIQEDGVCCKVIRTRWIPMAEVEKVDPAEILGVELSMDVLASVKDEDEAKAKLSPLSPSTANGLRDRRRKFLPRRRSEPRPAKNSSCERTSPPTALRPGLNSSPSQSVWKPSALPTNVWLKRLAAGWA